MEFVFVAPREALFPPPLPQGFRSFGTPAEARELLERIAVHGFFVQRDRAEVTPAWKQIIPYCVVASDERVLLMQRRAGGGEARLHDKLSIGVGGHINPVDGDLAGGLVEAAARREIAEELVVRGEVELRLAGFLNDDSNPVGAVHLGLVFTANVAGPVLIREEDVLTGRLVGPDELRASAERGANLETWSRILVANLDQLLTVHHQATEIAT